MNDYFYIGKGIYTIPEVSRYTGIDARKIRRWTAGYHKGQSKSYESVYKHDYEVLNEKMSLSFLDLIEIRFIDAFHKHGVSWKAIRLASEKAKQIIGKDHPFSTRKFYTDKRSILTRIAISENQSELLNLVKSQYEIDEILQPCLIEGIDFTDLDIASRWYPLGREKPIVIDPACNFGKPVLVGENIDTKLIFDLYKKNNSLEDISFWYQVKKELVKCAIEYEELLVA